jgi:hypothetical protein
VIARELARPAALGAVAIDLIGAWCDGRPGWPRLPLRYAAFITALAMVPCAVSFLVATARRLRVAGPRLRHPIDTLRLPLAVPRGYVGGAVLGGIAAMTAMGQSFGLYIFLAGVALVALALSQAVPRRL